MRRALFLGVVLTLAIVVTACAPATATPEPTFSVPVTGDTATPAVVSTATTTLSTSTAEATDGSPTAEATTDAATGTSSNANVRIATSSSTGVNEPFLVDQAGRALYLFTEDTQNGGTSSCAGDCLTNWPPVIVTGTPTAGLGIDAGMLGTITRDDGAMQATYNGWPLYYYAGDTTAGSISGQGVGGSWFLVSAMGTAIQQ